MASMGALGMLSKKSSGGPLAMGALQTGMDNLRKKKPAGAGTGMLTGGGGMGGALL